MPLTIDIEYFIEYNKYSILYCFLFLYLTTLFDMIISFTRPIFPRLTNKSKFILVSTSNNTQIDKTITGIPLLTRRLLQHQSCPTDYFLYRDLKIGNLMFKINILINFHCFLFSQCSIRHSQRNMDQRTKSCYCSINCFRFG